MLDCVPTVWQAPLMPFTTLDEHINCKSCTHQEQQVCSCTSLAMQDSQSADWDWHLTLVFLPHEALQQRR